MNPFEQLKTLVKERRLGFQMDETMTGTHRFLDGKGPEGEHPMEYRVTWGHANIVKWLNPFGDEFLVNTLSGKVDAGGLVVDADCEGALELRYVQEQLIRYTFTFKDDNQKAYQYVGEKRGLRPWNLHRTHTTCFGKITELETGETVSEGIVHFRLSTIPQFLLSFKIV